jgi:hypothetical protein
MPSPAEARMGFFDLPVSALSWADARLATVLPDALRIAAWGAVGALLSMALYRLVSPQRRLTRIAAEERSLKGRLRDESTALADGLAFSRRLLQLAFTRLCFAVPAVIVAALPVLFLMPWLDTRYTYELPSPERSAVVRTSPSTIQGTWIALGDTLPRIELRDERGDIVQSEPIVAPVPVIQKRAWWNRLVGNPLGYLPDEGPIERIDIDLPPRHILSVGPEWIRSWLAPFFASLLATSLLIKLIFRIR